MPQIIYPLITNAGRAAAQSQDGLGLDLQITHIQLGSGGYAVNAAAGSADYNRTGLVTVKETVRVAAGHKTGAGFRVDALFPAWVAATYGANEIGFWAGDPAAGGVLFAYWGQVAAFVQRNNVEYLASFAVGLASIGNVTVSFDPDYQKAVALMTYHEQSADPHPQYKRYFTLVGVSANTAIPVDRYGGLMVSNGGAALTHSLPSFSGRDPGEFIEVQNIAGYPCTITPGTGQFFSVVGASFSSIKLLPGEWARFTVPGGGTQWAVSGSGSLKYTGGFSSSLATPGWGYLPDGRIEQWGSGLYGADTAVTFPVAFPTVCLNVLIGPANYDSPAPSPTKVTPIGAYAWTQTGFNASSASGVNLAGSWRAIGW